MNNTFETKNHSDSDKKQADIDRLCVLAVKYTPKNTHDWAELVNLLDNLSTWKGYPYPQK
jgi:hypothetical protein